MKSFVRLTILFCLFFGGQTLLAQEMVYQAETGKLLGKSSLSSVRNGYIGESYVTGLEKNGDGVEIEAEVPVSGYFDLYIRYAASFSDKMNFVYVNGQNIGNRLFPESIEFRDIKVGLVFLKEGNNTISIKKDWGFIDIDLIKIERVHISSQNESPLHLDPIHNELVTPHPSNASVELMSYLIECYGKKVISGQQGDQEELKFIFDNSSKLPAIRGFDLLSYSPSMAWYDGTTNEIVKWFKYYRGIPTVCWHWFAPTADRTVPNKSFYKWDTYFDPSKAIDTASVEYRLLIRDMDSIASQLKYIQNAQVPILWRPLHEGLVGGFWWGAGGPEVYTKLYKILFDRLVHYHKLNNLIWVWTTSEREGAELWYPGNEYVDIISTDIYSEPNVVFNGMSIYNSLVSRYSTKMVALSEHDRVPTPQFIINSETYWSWFCVWEGEYIMNERNKMVSHLREVYNDSLIITLDELPDRIFKHVGDRKLSYEERVDQLLEYTNGLDEAKANLGSKVKFSNSQKGMMFIYVFGLLIMVFSICLFIRRVVFNIKKW